MKNNKRSSIESVESEDEDMNEDGEPKLCDILHSKDPCPLFLLYTYAKGFITNEDDLQTLKQLALMVKDRLRRSNEKNKKLRRLLKMEPNEKVKYLLEQLT